jgi:hypothetical protein
MDLQHRGVVKPRYIRVSYTGEPEAAKVLSAVRRAVASADDSHSRGIILDLSQTDHSLSLEDRIRAGTAVAALQSRAGRQIPVAVIVPGDSIDPQKVGTKAAARRGGRLNAFTSPEEARAWLRTQ